MSDPVVVETLRRRYVEDPERSNATLVSLVWIDAESGFWVRIPVSRSLIGEPDFDLVAYLDKQFDYARAGAIG